MKRSIKEAILLVIYLIGVFTFVVSLNFDQPYRTIIFVVSLLIELFMVLLRKKWKIVGSKK